MNGNYNSSTNSSGTLNDEISRSMQVYFKAKENSRYLTEDNKILVSNTEYYISSIPNSHPFKQVINNEINTYYLKAKELGQAENRNNADELRQTGQTRALVKQEEMAPSRRAAFINVAILIYGSLNIGFILAIALLK
ncbi:MAG: hypothetical protein NC483_04375 [Ruminococcus sp.]|nr:hypothetical protein [Ruminococcus sp.]